MSGTSSLTDRTVSGAAWAILGRGLHQAMGVALSVALWRLLEPADYGIVGMALVFVYLASEVRDLRFSDALIQRKELDPVLLDSAFYAHAGAGLALSLLLVASAALIARFYARPDLLPVAAALALKPLLDSLSDISRALLGRRMAFKMIALAEIAGLAVSGGLAIALAAAGCGSWALVGLNLAGSLVTSAVLVAEARWLPRARFSIPGIRELRKFSACLYAARLTTTFTANVDKLLVGRALGGAALGLYSFAYGVMTFPIQNISLAVGRVMFPALSEIQDEPERFRSAYLRAVRFISLVTFPLTAGLCATAPDFVLALPGAKWIEAVPVLRVLAAAGFIESVLWAAGWIYLARARTDVDFLWSLASMLITVVALSIGVRYGIQGAAVAYLVRTLILAAPACAISFRLVGLRFSVFLRWLAPTAGAAMVMSAAVLLLGEVIRTQVTLPAWAMLTIEVPVGAGVYAACLWASRAEAWTEALGLLRNYMKRGRFSR